MVLIKYEIGIWFGIWFPQIRAFSSFKSTCHVTILKMTQIMVLLQTIFKLVLNKHRDQYFQLHKKPLNQNTGYLLLKWLQSICTFLWLSLVLLPGWFHRHPAGHRLPKIQINCEGYIYLVYTYRPRLHQCIKVTLVYTFRSRLHQCIKTFKSYRVLQYIHITI